MATNGNFLNFAGNKLGVDPGFGKVILVYPEKTVVSLSDLLVENINAAIAAGDIVGVIKDWHTVAGAPVGEISVERPGTGTMKLIREEIAADVLTFESNLQNRTVLAELVKQGNVHCLLLDDQGNVFGEKSNTTGNIDTAIFNFSTKATSSFQRDNATDKTIAVIVRYMVEDLDFMDADVEVESIVSKSLVNLYLSSVTTLTSTAAVFVLKVKEKATGDIFAGAIATGAVSVSGATISSTSAAYVPATGLLTVTLAGTGFAVPNQAFNVTIDGSEAYSAQTRVKLGE